MVEDEWVVVDEVAGSLMGEILRGLLETQGIPVLLAQEGAGHSVYGLTVGPLGSVQILVPPEQASNARQMLDDYYAGAFQQAESPDEPVDEQDWDDLPLGDEET
ncbi:MAG: DUF2007 domain-containing protein [Anaerolineales bacterium]|nr:DUF2007 domain-containing protein [Anaerolineales bacterium]